MSVTSGVLKSGELDYALPHAVNLAEAGHTVQNKRIGISICVMILSRHPDTILQGYLFCAEIMPPEHELQLMLVNTLRKVNYFEHRTLYVETYGCCKDLESSAIPRICLALDTLITSANTDVIPAVQSRLHELLSHNSSVCILAQTCQS